LGRHETFIDHAKGNFFITQNAWIDPVRGALQTHRPGDLCVHQAPANGRPGEAGISVDKFGQTLSLNRTIGVSDLELFATAASGSHL
jgi:hypothetical protein